MRRRTSNQEKRSVKGCGRRQDEDETVWKLENMRCDTIEGKRKENQIFEVYSFFFNLSSLIIEIVET